MAHRNYINKHIPPIKIIGIPRIAPIPVIVRIVPTIIFKSPTALRVGFQNKGNKNTTANNTIQISIAMTYCIFRLAYWHGAKD